jgi:hypothetical protein
MISMPRSSRRQVLSVALALLAIGGLLAASGHGHADGDDHAQCLLCVASFGHIAVPGAVLVLLVAWTVLGPAVFCKCICPDAPNRFSVSPRAPPA